MRFRQINRITHRSHFQKNSHKFYHLWFIINNTIISILLKIYARHHSYSAHSISSYRTFSFAVSPGLRPKCSVTSHRWQCSRQSKAFSWSCEIRLASKHSEPETSKTSQISVTLSTMNPLGTQWFGSSKWSGPSPSSVVWTGLWRAVCNLHTTGRQMPVLYVLLVVFFVSATSELPSCSSEAKTNHQSIQWKPLWHHHTVQAKRLWNCCDSPSVCMHALQCCKRLLCRQRHLLDSGQPTASLPATLLRKPVSSTCICDLILSPSPILHDLRWGKEQRLTGRSRALSFGAAPFLAQRRSRVNTKLLPLHHFSGQFPAPWSPHRWTPSPGVKTSFPSWSGQSTSFLLK